MTSIEADFARLLKESQSVKKAITLIPKKEKRRDHTHPSVVLPQQLRITRNPWEVENLCMYVNEIRCMCCGVTYLSPSEIYYVEKKRTRNGADEAIIEAVETLQGYNHLPRKTFLRPVEIQECHECFSDYLPSAREQLESSE